MGTRVSQCKLHLRRRRVLTAPHPPLILPNPLRTLDLPFPCRYQKLDCVGRGGSSKVFKVLACNRQIYALKRWEGWGDGGGLKVLGRGGGL